MKKLIIVWIAVILLALKIGSCVSKTEYQKLHQQTIARGVNLK